MELDSKDWAILAQLQRDAAQPVQAIADAVGLSVNPCWRRIKRMEESGLIARRVALLDPAMAGSGTCVFVTIRTRRHDAECFQETKCRPLDHGGPCRR